MLGALRYRPGALRNGQELPSGWQLAQLPMALALQDGRLSSCFSTERKVDYSRLLPIRSVTFLPYEHCPRNQPPTVLELECLSRDEMKRVDDYIKWWREGKELRLQELKELRLQEPARRVLQPAEEQQPQRPTAGCQRGRWGLRRDCDFKSTWFLSQRQIKHENMLAKAKSDKEAAEIEAERYLLGATESSAATSSSSVVASTSPPSASEPSCSAVKELESTVSASALKELESTVSVDEACAAKELELCAISGLVPAPSSEPAGAVF